MSQSLCVCARSHGGNDRRVDMPHPWCECALPRGGRLPRPVKGGDVHDISHGSYSVQPIFKQSILFVIEMIIGIAAMAMTIVAIQIILLIIYK